MAALVDRLFERHGRPVLDYDFYEPFAPADGLEPAVHEELRIWAQALRACRSGNWDLAEVNLHDLQRLAPGCMLCPMYADRVRNARSTPMTADWEPVTVFDEK